MLNKKLLSYIVLLGSYLLLAACTSVGPIVKANIASGPFINPNVYHQPSPVQVTIYQLKSRPAFQQANFFALYSDPTGTLGNDLLDKQEIDLRPAQQTTVRQLLAPDTNYIGVLAAFRNPDAAKWRQIVPVKQGKNITLQIVVKGIVVLVRPK